MLTDVRCAGPYQQSYLRRVLEERGPRWYGMDDATQEYAFHLQLVARDLPWGQRADAGDAAFSRFLSLESGWLQPLSEAELAAIGRAKMPLTVIYGENDFIPMGGAAVAAAALPPGSCQAFVIDGANHHMYSRDAEAFNALVAGVPADGVRPLAPDGTAEPDGGGTEGGSLLGPEGRAPADRTRSPSSSPGPEQQPRTALNSGVATSMAK